MTDSEYKKPAPNCRDHQVFQFSGDPWGQFQYLTGDALSEVMRPGYWNQSRRRFEIYNLVLIDVLTDGKDGLMLTRLRVTKCEKRPVVMTKHNKPTDVEVMILGEPQYLNALRSFDRWTQDCKDVAVLRARIAEANSKPVQAKTGEPKTVETKTDAATKDKKDKAPKKDKEPKEKDKK